MKKYSYILIALFLFSCNSYKGKCIACHDGDSITLLTESGKVLKIRLAECDANELGQPKGYEAKLFTESHLLNREIVAKQIAIDKYHRHVCKVYVNGVYFDKELVLAGWAVVYRKYASNDMWEAQQEAKSKRIGIWTGNEILPYKWRKEHKHSY